MYFTLRCFADERKKKTNEQTKQNRQTKQQQQQQKNTSTNKQNKTGIGDGNNDHTLQVLISNSSCKCNKVVSTFDCFARNVGFFFTVLVVAFLSYNNKKKKKKKKPTSTSHLNQTLNGVF